MVVAQIDLHSSFGGSRAAAGVLVDLRLTKRPMPSAGVEPNVPFLVESQKNFMNEVQANLPCDTFDVRLLEAHDLAGQIVLVHDITLVAQQIVEASCQSPDRTFFLLEAVVEWLTRLGILRMIEDPEDSHLDDGQRFEKHIAVHLVDDPFGEQPGLD